MEQFARRRRRVVITDDSDMVINRLGRPGSRQRITVSAPLDIAADFYSHAIGVQVNADNLSRPLAAAKPQPAAWVSRAGVKRKVARVVLTLMALVLLIVMGTNVYALNTISHRVTNVQREIVRTQEKSKKLNAELMTAEKNVNVGYEAVRYGMISAKAVESIRISLPEDIRKAKD